MRACFIPGILGALLILSGLGYVIASLTGLLFPAYGNVVGSIATIPSGIGELAIMLFLLIRV